jgi:hypothetical protein
MTIETGLWDIGIEVLDEKKVGVGARIVGLAAFPGRTGNETYAADEESSLPDWYCGRGDYAAQTLHAVTIIRGGKGFSLD